MSDGSNGSGIVLNGAERRTGGQVSAFFDARQSVELSAVSEPTSWFTDPALA
jgi:hypothetical protein